MKKIIFFLATIALISITSCEQEIVNQDIDFSNFTGQWEVNAHIDSEYIFGPFNITTLKNTPAGNDSITILHNGNFWVFKSKAQTNRENNTFQTEFSQCETDEFGSGIKIFNGKIVGTDSIYLEIQFESDETPYGYTYQLKGHRISE